MLATERFATILEQLEKQGSVSVTELANLLDTSESTIRRDLNELDLKGLLVKVHGGAAPIGTTTTVIKDDEVVRRRELHYVEKQRIAKFAAKLVEPNSFVYIDAGTTTEFLAKHLEESSATYVSNSFSVAKILAAKGMTCYLLGGLLKASTEALVGEHALLSLMQYHFTIGFFGTNGITQQAGFTTPEPGEAAVKRLAWKQSHTRYVLADPSKFALEAAVSFADFETGTIITTQLSTEEYRKFPHITEV